MEQSYNDELIRIYDLIRRLQSELSNLAKDFYKQSVISYNEIQGTPQALSSFYNDMNYVSKEEVDYKILSIPSIDDSNYLKKSGDKVLDCNIITTFAGLKTITPRKDDSSNAVATTEFVHELIDESSKNTEKYISGIYSSKDNVSQEQMKAAIKKALLQYYNSMEVDSKIISAISRLYIPSKTSDLRNDSGFITINDVPLSAVTSVNGQTGDVTIQIPTVPTLISAFTNDAGYITDPGVTSVNNQTGAVYIQENVQANWNSTTGLSAILNKPALRRVATTGSYNDLDDKPTIPTNTSLLINDSGFLTEQQDISGKADIEDLAVVAFSGSYIDLSNKPTIPTNLSELTNDNNFATLSDVQTEVSNLVDQAPETLNTLNELAAALGDDPNFATTVSTQIGTKYTKPSTGIPYSDLNASVLSSLDKADTALQSFTETDPTVPTWAKASTKPTYTAAEVGALPDTTVIPQVLDYPSGIETDAAPSVSAVQRWISEVDFRTYIDDKTIGINTDDEMYVKSLSADKLTNGTNNKVFTASELTKLAGIAAGAEVNVQSDWNQTVTTADDYIKNKPTIPSLSGYATETWVGQQGYLTQHLDISGKANTADLATVATSGSYNDLSDKPTIPTVPTNISSFTNDSGYLTSYTETDPTVPSWAKAQSKPTYDYSEITNTPNIPTVPTNVSAFTNDAGYLTQHLDISGKADSSSLATVATSGDYTDLINTPTIPTVPSNLVTGTSLSYMIWTGTQLEYDAIVTKDSDTIYFIKEPTA